MSNYIDGTDLILAVDGKALGHSTSCKISYKADTGTRKTKEAAAGKWDEKYVKSLGVSISADGFVFDDDDGFGLDKLKSCFMAAIPVSASWGHAGDSSHVESCQVVVTSLDQDGPAGDDEKWSVTLENSGAVTTSTSGPAITRDYGRSGQ